MLRGHRGRIGGFEHFPGRARQGGDDAHALPRRGQGLGTRKLVADQQEQGRVGEGRRPEQRIAFATAKDLEIEQLTIDLRLEDRRRRGDRPVLRLCAAR